MTLFEAYLITTLIPNFGGLLTAVAALSFLTIFIWGLFYVASDFDETFKPPIFKLVTFLIVFGVFSCLFPTTKQVAATIGLKAITSEGVQQMASPASEFIQEWLKQQTEELRK